MPVGGLLRRAFLRFTGGEGDASASRDAVLLEVLGARRSASQQELGERLGINRTVMVRVVDRLEAAGWVTRERNPRDRRSYALALTDDGRRAIAGLRRAASERAAALTARLSEPERERLHVLLTRLLPDPTSPVTGGTEFLVTQAYLRVRRIGEDQLADVGLRMQHFGPLAALEESGPSPQRDVARGLEITEPAVAELVDELVTAGLVTRGRDPHDRRRYALELTDTGRDRLARIREAQQEVQRRVTGILGEEDTGELRRLLLKLTGQPA